MLDHLSIQCDDPQRSARFYAEVLAPLGGRELMQVDGRVGYGAEFPSFWLGPHETGVGFRESHIAFRAPSRVAVDQFFEAALAAGATPLHAPRIWDEYHPGYYGAFVRDPDGNNVEAVHHTFDQPADETP